MTTSKPKKVAIVHDWLYGGGAELVVEQLHKLFPDAPIYTGYCSDAWRARLDDKVVTGWLQHLGSGTLRKLAILPRLWWFRGLDLSAFDLVIISTGNGEAKAIRVPKSTTTICYCHTPNHFYWRQYREYLKRPGFGLLNPLARLGLKLFVGPLRRWDHRAAQRITHFIANSNHIKNDVKIYYGREAEVIHPPVDTARFAAAPETKRQGFITADRQVPAKHIDLIIEACNKISAPLTVIGKGSEHENLKRLAGPSVTVIDRFVTDNELPAYFAGAQAFIKASFEDFGVTPVEALAAGTPVIAYQAGGALDYVKPGQTGVFFREQTVDSLAQALISFQPKLFKHEAIRAAATTFSPEAFRTHLQGYIAKHYKEK